mgnify:CR=1 FL=1
MKLIIVSCLFILGCATTASPAPAQTVYTPDGTYTCTVYDDGTRICF